jgi:hypothetical protein
MVAVEACFAAKLHSSQAMANHTKATIAHIASKFAGAFGHESCEGHCRTLSVTPDGAPHFSDHNFEEEIAQQPVP